MSKLVNIYGIFDPIDGALRYVGMTCKALAHRLLGHLHNPSNSRMAEWIKSLKDVGHLPRIELIEVVRSHAALAREGYWIRRYQGCGLLNARKMG